MEHQNESESLHQATRTTSKTHRNGIPPEDGSERAADPVMGTTETDGKKQSRTPEDGAADGAEDRSRMDRAEEMVDRIAERVAQFTSVWGRKLLKLGARAREEAEDMWAEAQNIRRGGNS
jgi:hypothetical protein